MFNFITVKPHATPGVGGSMTFQKLLGMVAVAIFAMISTATADPAPPISVFQKDARILFQGDSITDGNRGRTADPNHILGHGYVFIIAAKYGAQLPELGMSFLNRGVSGNKVSDLTARWQTDTLDLKPDVLSVLVGVNDANANVPVADYEKNLDALLAQTLAANPSTRLVLCEPFTLPGANHQNDWAVWRANIQSRQDAVARLAAKYQVPLVHFQRAFDEAALRAPASYWIWDTVHPTYSGHQIMADEWVRTVSQFKFPAQPFVPAKETPVGAKE